MIRPELSIVIPTHQRPDMVVRLLRSLKLQSATKEFEVIVISNLPDLDLQKHLREFSGVRYFVVGRRGVNRARNLGLEKARADVALFLDDDCVAPGPELLWSHLRIHQQESEVAAIGGLYVLPEGGSRWSQIYHDAACDWLNEIAETGGETWALLGGHVSYKLAKLREKNLRFNSEIEFGGAETDLHLRMVASGLKLRLHPELSVVHDPGVNFQQLLRKAFAQGQGEGARVSSGLVPPVGARFRSSRAQGIFYRWPFLVGRRWGERRGWLHIHPLALIGISVSVGLGMLLAARNGPGLTQALLRLRLLSEQRSLVKQALSGNKAPGL